MHIRSLIRSFVFITLLGAGLFSCTEKYVPQSGEIDMKIDIPLGTEFEYRDDNKVENFLPSIVNEGMGTINKRQRRIALISRKMNPGSHLYVKPVAKLTYSRDGKEKEIYLAVPAEEKYRTIEISSYDDLITEYYSTKHIIEYWYANRYGLGGVSDIRWSTY